MKQQNKLCISFIYFITAALVAFVFLFGLTTGTNTYAADDTATSFDETNVVDDLKAAEFVLEDYPKNSEGELQVIYFVEYGYNIRANEQDNYGLYIYVYNPAEIAIDVDGKNFVQISSKHDESGKPTDYSKYSVKCVSKSSGVYGKLFYKFKVVAGLSEQLAHIDDEVRRYDVSGIELQTAGEANATEYPISTTFYYSGYAKGFGKDTAADSTLTCRTESLETVSFDVKHTTYRYQNEKKGGQEIASVYFKVPKKYFDTYDGLQKIKAEWLKGVTKDILVVNDKTLYSYLKNWVGRDVGKGSFDMKYGFYSKADSYMNTKTPSNNEFAWVYNVMYSDEQENSMIKDFWGPSSYDYRMTVLYWLFYGEGDLKDIRIASGNVLNYYNNSEYKKEMLMSVDTEKTVKVIDAEDVFTLEGFDKNANLVNMFTKLFFPDIETSDLKDISPIQVLTSEDIKGTDEEIAERIYVDEKDVSDIKVCVNDTSSKTVLFRFAVNSYANVLISYYNRESLDVGLTSESYKETGYAYRNRLPIYIDFDVIWLGFSKGDKLTIIPAVSSPITVIGGTQPPTKDLGEKAKDALEDFWKKIQDAKDELLKVLKWIGIALGAVLVVLLMYIVVNAIVKACTAVSKRSKSVPRKTYTNATKHNTTPKKKA